jgi:hypothetical protein
MRNLWEDSQLHHQYRLVERTTGGLIEDSIEIHTIELSKYNGSAESVQSGTELQKWCYWIKNADRHTEEELRELLPGLEFLQATSELSGIQAITEEKEMYDSREKALLDYESNLIDARQEGRQEGELIGMEIGRIQLLQELLELPLQNRKELAAMPSEEIVGLRKTLQSKLRDRNA